MKLLAKTSRINLVLSSILFSLTGIGLYFLLTSMVNEEFGEKLVVNKERIVAQLKSGDRVNPLPPVMEIHKMPSFYHQDPVLKDTLVFDPIEGENELFKQLEVYEQIGGSVYRIVVRQVIFEPFDFIGSIGVVLLLAFFILLASQFLLQRRLSSMLWRDFYHTLELLKVYSLKMKTALELEPSQVSEFQELNKALSELSKRISRDYQMLKAFSEDAAHEIQTPLAIVQSQLEILIQKADWQPHEGQALQKSQTAIRRLSLLSRDLLLLTKLENRQDMETGPVQLEQLLTQTINLFEDRIQARVLSLETNIDPVTIEANDNHVEILLSNLLGNAVKHSLKGSTVKIKLDEKGFRMSNKGLPLSKAPENMFHRFSKSDPSSASLGLGLSIVQKICEINGWTLEYRVDGDWHILSVRNF